MPKTLSIDPTRCTGCRVCEIVCSLEHTGECNPNRARIKVMKNDEEGLDLPVVCMHCADPPCVEVCPTGAMTRDNSSGAVSILDEVCLGCKLCMLVCPLGAVTVDSGSPQGRVMKCDLCGGNPKCVIFCEPKAINFVPVEELAGHTRDKVWRAYSKAALQRD
jgi:anaerobic carbon-monoxide dehydrogenase iron sulfur subunit